MDRSVRQSVDPVRMGVYGPGDSVFGSPHCRMSPVRSKATRANVSKCEMHINAKI